MSHPRTNSNDHNAPLSNNKLIHRLYAIDRSDPAKARQQALELLSAVDQYETQVRDCINRETHRIAALRRRLAMMDDGFEQASPDGSRLRNLEETGAGGSRLDKQIVSSFHSTSTEEHAMPTVTNFTQEIRRVSTKVKADTAERQRLESQRTRDNADLAREKSKATPHKPLVHNLEESIRVATAEIDRLNEEIATDGKRLDALWQRKQPRIGGAPSVR